MVGPGFSVWWDQGKGLWTRWARARVYETRLGGRSLHSPRALAPIMCPSPCMCPYPPPPSPSPPPLHAHHTPLLSPCHTPVLGRPPLRPIPQQGQYLIDSMPLRSRKMRPCTVKGNERSTEAPRGTDHTGCMLLAPHAPSPACT